MRQIDWVPAEAPKAKKEIPPQWIGTVITLIVLTLIGFMAQFPAVPQP